MTNSTPPFRADHVGSLLRPAAVTAARKAFFEEGSISRAELHEGYTSYSGLRAILGLPAVA